VDGYADTYVQNVALQYNIINTEGTASFALRRYASAETFQVDHNRWITPENCRAVHRRRETPLRVPLLCSGGNGEEQAVGAIEKAQPDAPVYGLAA
jgi:hypothetical protein